MIQIIYYSRFLADKKLDFANLSLCSRTQTTKSVLIIGVMFKLLNDTVESSTDFYVETLMYDVFHCCG